MDFTAPLFKRVSRAAPIYPCTDHVASVRDMNTGMVRRPRAGVPGTRRWRAVPRVGYYPVRAGFFRISRLCVRFERDPQASCVART